MNDSEGEYWNSVTIWISIANLLLGIIVIGIGVWWFPISAGILCLLAVRFVLERVPK